MLNAKGLTKVMRALTGDNPRAAMMGLAQGITDHDKFRRMLVKVEPDKRRSCYETMKHLVPFKVKPLDAYLIQAGEIAEREQQPTIDAEGRLQEFKVPEVGNKLIDAANKALGTGTATLTCQQCTVQEKFTGETKVAAHIKAVDAGWAFRSEKWYCRKCTEN